MSTESKEIQETRAAIAERKALRAKLNAVVAQIPPGIDFIITFHQKGNRSTNVHSDNDKVLMGMLDQIMAAINGRGKPDENVLPLQG